MRARACLLLAAACAVLASGCGKAEPPQTIGGHRVPGNDELTAWVRGWVIEDLALQAAPEEDRTIHPEQMSNFVVQETTYDSYQQLFSAHVSFEMMKATRHIRVEGEIRYRPIQAGDEGGDLLFVDFVSSGVTEIASW